MIAHIEHKGRTFSIDLQKPIDISIPLSPVGPRAWYVDPMKISPVINQHFRGSVRLGGSVNFREVTFNPHGHGTHTESFGHISPQTDPVHNIFKRYFFFAKLVTIDPDLSISDFKWRKKGDRIITRDQMETAVGDSDCEAVIVRTLPNTSDKTSKNYSATNFPYFEKEALQFLAEKNVSHLLTDLPSVDREEDGGLLEAHHAFWLHNGSWREDCTITEFIYAADQIADGEYILNLQVIPLVNDAAPSRPVLYLVS